MSNPCKVFQYAVKFVCGLARPVEQLHQTVVAPGQYFTAINILNPAVCKTVPLRWRVVVANGHDLAPGPISAPRRISLRPGAGVEIDTHHILGKGQPLLRKGFVIIEAPCELDVVAVYSVAPPTAPPIGGVVAFHTERVPARHHDVCRDDLELDLSTGVRPWTLTRATSPANLPLPGLTTPCPATVIPDAQRHPLWGTLPGARWISVQSFANVPNPPPPAAPWFLPGTYTFRTCFSLCAGFEAAVLDLWTLVDDSAVVRWNGTPLLPPLAGYGGPPQHRQITTGFLPGVNCLEIVVRNVANAANPNPIGVAARAIVRAKRGVCPDCGCGCDDDDAPAPARTVTDGELATEDDVELADGLTLAGDPPG